MRIVSILLVSILVLMLAGAALAGEKVYGNGVTGKDVQKVSEILADPDAFIGQTVRVQGTAVAGCAHRGCWINIASDKEGETIRMQVKDGEIVFPPEIIGETVIAEGVWTANKLTLEQTKAMCAAEARKEGKEYDPADVVTCKTAYQISGTGAVVVKADTK